MTLQEAEAAVRRVIGHPYTSEVGERARLGALATALQYHEVSLGGLATLLGAPLAPPKRRVPTKQETGKPKPTGDRPMLDALLAWVARERAAHLKRLRVERERVPGPDARDLGVAATRCCRPPGRG